MRRGLVSVVSVAVLAVAGCSDEGDDASERSGSSATVTLTVSDADVGFLQDMYAHHTQAVVLANLAAQHGEDTRVRSLALDIAVSQAGEQGQMLAMLRDRGEDLGARHREAMAWAGHPVPLAEMPGMVDPADLAAFQQLRGSELDEQFVELMVSHHEGGVVMAGHALGDGRGSVGVTDPAVVDLATQMRSTQQRELTELELLGG